MITTYVIITEYKKNKHIPDMKYWPCFTYITQRLHHKKKKKGRLNILYQGPLITHHGHCINKVPNQGWLNHVLYSLLTDRQTHTHTYKRLFKPCSMQSPHRHTHKRLVKPCSIQSAHRQTHTHTKGWLNHVLYSLLTDTQSNPNIPAGSTTSL